MRHQKVCLVLEITSDINHVALVGISVSALCLEHDCSEAFAYQLQTCVVEGLNNIIIHGHDNEHGHIIRTEVCFYAERVEVTLTDRGTTYQGPLGASPVDITDANGRGWYIIQQWSDAISYTSEAGVNRLTLTKYCAHEKNSDTP